LMQGYTSTRRAGFPFPSHQRAKRAFRKTIAAPRPRCVR
jgi:hypothetical protein